MTYVAMVSCFVQHTVKELLFWSGSRLFGTTPCEIAEDAASVREPDFTDMEQTVGSLAALCLNLGPKRQFQQEVVILILL